ncbi:ABC transporter ATP-binding protein [Acetobacter cerevisiae]|uniref:ABC transporter domain-containing protein n=1 Tax=Acetobacter cerevisiae TaxID=178900 RepID=A0A149V7D3_9PROT|nr:ABC transporter ATP-binding protein [Acetobacter cerevisiae]KXV76002.1 hypothetical protein AD954_13645 [Acetobacter cerevisiae]
MGRELVVRELTKTYRNGVRALDGISLDISPGIYGLLGPNGAGKSSLMRTLATLQVPDSGSISFDGTDVLVNPAALRTRLGYLPQQIGAYPGVSARSLLERFAWLKGYTRRAVRCMQVEALLEQVNLRDVADRPATTFSGGMLRRFGIAIALIGSPDLLIVDEPTAGLDPEERNRFHRVLADVAREAVVLLSTHIVEDIENLCYRLAIIAKGRVVAEGTVADLTGAYRGQLWEMIVPHGVSLPPALHAVAVPEGVRAVIRAPRPPGPDYIVHPPRLQDVYYAVLQDHEVRTQQS